jgi:hypothetical protein
MHDTSLIEQVQNIEVVHIDMHDDSDNLAASEGKSLLDEIKSFRELVYELDGVDGRWDQKDWHIDDNLPLQEFVKQTLEIVNNLSAKEALVQPNIQLPTTSVRNGQEIHQLVVDMGGPWRNFTTKLSGFIESKYIYMIYNMYFIYEVTFILCMYLKNMKSNN